MKGYEIRPWLNLKKKLKAHLIKLVCEELVYFSQCDFEEIHLGCNLRLSIVIWKGIGYQLDVHP